MELQLFLRNLIYLLSRPCFETTSVINRLFLPPLPPSLFSPFRGIFWRNAFSHLPSGRWDSYETTMRQTSVSLQRLSCLAAAAEFWGPVEKLRGDHYGDESQAWSGWKIKRHQSTNMERMHAVLFYSLIGVRSPLLLCCLSLVIAPGLQSLQHTATSLMASWWNSFFIITCTAPLNSCKRM